ncbi:MULTISPECIES: DUF1707 domain-containing protein [Streptomyces]|uniref:DUF1707 domain-containing protein n=2 Tax=Streptomyces rimosus subsp. rimosus TaxID=132474 RepID=L8EJW8_STRR1|nr:MULTISPECIES: DUF1707 domain-containing protein [Streptomyces]KOG69277.1 hypothetical protein ADK78_33955 [Kitasatospora aureofaciens]MYT46819.1 DUF1707 domain-containing protein [Streptomyces sp. SID5471]KEF03981.1 hypothetical protein DF17_26290 [Streptomyces rimosus]KEF17434.1 hypothetical protein DF18_28965 [Streptomyces rimosus]KOT28950.1 hypothetical protein ADK42_32915 [Streptomyces rimosus subsp. rimosus]
MTDELPDLRASDADRERVAEILREALAEGRLEMAEFDERLTAAYQARTVGALKPLVADLPQPHDDRTAATRAATSGALSWRERIGGEPTSRGAFAFWSGFSRKGRWTVPRVFTAGVFQAGGEIDLRDAYFEAGEVTVRCFALMGGIDVVVPPGVEVQVTGWGFMGGFDNGDGEPGDPGAPRVKITGFAMMAGVGVRRKMSKREKERLKLERERRAESALPREPGRREVPDRLRKELD